MMSRLKGWPFVTDNFSCWKHRFDPLLVGATNHARPQLVEQVEQNLMLGVDFVQPKGVSVSPGN